MPVYTTTWCNIPGIKVLLLTKGKRKRENEYEKADRMEKLGAGREPRGRSFRTRWYSSIPGQFTPVYCSGANRKTHAEVGGDERRATIPVRRQENENDHLNIHYGMKSDVCCLRCIVAKPLFPYHMTPSTHPVSEHISISLFIADV